MATQKNSLAFASKPHVIVVDDDKRIRDLLTRYLMERDYMVTSAASAKDARLILADTQIDAAIFDIMMPEETGLELAKDLRGQGADYPIIFLTALGDVQDRISGFEAGADDYLPKPFEPQELLLRLEAILRRTMQAPTQEGTLQLGALSFNLSQGLLSDGNGAAITLTDTERELLLTLAQKAGQVITREDLADIAGVNSERAIDVQILRLRRKLESDAKEPRILQTVRGQGYVLRGHIISDGEG